MLNEELITLLPRFVDQRGPSHDEISRMVARAGLSDAEPDSQDGVQRGKVKRLRMILHMPLIVSRTRVRGLSSSLSIRSAHPAASGSVRQIAPDPRLSRNFARRFGWSASTWIRKAISGRPFSKTSSGLS